MVIPIAQLEKLPFLRMCNGISLTSATGSAGKIKLA